MSVPVVIHWQERCARPARLSLVHLLEASAVCGRGCDWRGGYGQVWGAFGCVREGLRPWCYATQVVWRGAVSVCMLSLYVPAAAILGLVLLSRVFLWRRIAMLDSCVPVSPSVTTLHTSRQGVHSPTPHQQSCAPLHWICWGAIQLIAVGSVLLGCTGLLVVCVRKLVHSGLLRCVKVSGKRNRC
jgi:hypothetical protein